MSVSTEETTDLRPSTRRQAARVLAIAREELGMDLAYLSEFTGAQQVILETDGRSNGVKIDVGMSAMLTDGYCQRVVDGLLGNVVPDTSADEVTAALPITKAAGLGAYVGFPVRYGDGEIFGTLCAASDHPEPSLVDRDMAFMRVLARVLADTLDEDRERDRLETALSGSTETLHETAERLAESHTEMVRRLSMAVEFRDDATGGHSRRVAEMSEALAAVAGLEEEQCTLIRLASPLHDVGKVAIPDSILLKPGRLTAGERIRMNRHAQIGHDLLKGSSSPVLQMAATIALTHHERYDGSGYPQRLAGEDIPIEGRIVAIVDVYDALSSDRVYRAGWPPERIREVFQQGRGSEFDPGLVDLFLSSCLPD